MKMPGNQKMTIRLNKYISESGIASRRKAEELILQGRVMINSKPAKELSLKVDPEIDVVEVDGEKILPRRHLYFVLNKPKGYITSTADEKDRRTVVELIKTKEKIFPVGRLDYNTTGVLLLTNDGEFSNLLTHPRNKVPREYEAWLDRNLEEKDRETLQKGIYIDGKRGRFVSTSFSNKKSRKQVNVIVEEGRNHFVKNMFAALGYTVTGLNRKSYAGITASIPIGSYRTLTKDEISEVIQTYGK